MFEIQCQVPSIGYAIFQIVVSGNIVLPVKCRVVVLIGIKSVVEVIKPCHTEEKFVRDQRGSETSAVALLTVITKVHFSKAVELIGRLPGDDIDYATHGIASIQCSLRASQYFDA